MKNALRELIQEGWIVALFGGCLMSLRILVSKEKLSLLQQLKNILIAAISCAMAFFLIDGCSMGDFYKAIIYGVIGTVSPEIITGVVKLAKSFASNPDHYIPHDHEKK